jgi:hypothetical protein
MVDSGLMLFISRFNAFCPGFKPFCPILGPIGKLPNEGSTAGDGLMLFISGLMLFINDPLPSETQQTIATQNFDVISTIFA